MRLLARARRRTTIAWVLSVVLLVLAIGVGLFVRRFVADFQRTRALEAEVDEEMSEIASLDLDEAFSRAERVIQQQARVEEWASPIPPAIDARLARLDARVAALLRRSRRVTFPETGTWLSAELLDQLDLADWRWSIGADSERKDWRLCIEPDGNAVAEVISRRVKQRYGSLWHYILLAEDEA
jgi:hypothetical protein